MARAAAQHTPPHALAHPRDPLRLRMERAVERMLAAAERLIAEMDFLDGNGEADELDAGEHDTADHEYSLGAPDLLTDQTEWFAGLQEHGEPEDEHDREHDPVDLEASLGWTADEAAIPGDEPRDCTHYIDGELDDSDLEDGGDTEAVNEDGSDVPETARRNNTLLTLAIGERHGRPYIADPAMVRLLGELAAHDLPGERTILVDGVPVRLHKAAMAYAGFPTATLPVMTSGEPASVRVGALR